MNWFWQRDWEIEQLNRLCPITLVTGLPYTHSVIIKSKEVYNEE